jgi:hypothetical protein
MNNSNCNTANNLIFMDPALKKASIHPTYIISEAMKINSFLIRLHKEIFVSWKIIKNSSKTEILSKVKQIIKIKFMMISRMILENVIFVLWI